MATENEKDKDDDSPLGDVTVVIEGEAESTPPEKKGAEEKKPAPDDERRAKDDDGEEAEEREADHLSDEERQALREKRKKENALRRQRAKEREEAREREIAELKRTVQELRETTASVAHRTSQSDFHRIEAGIADSQRAMEEAKGLIAKAATENNGQALAEAQEAYYEARQRAEYLSRLKHGVVAREQEEKRPKVDPAVARHAQAWMAKNTWYDPRSGDEDSMIALAIDDALAKQGYDPKTKDYWDEFEKRVAKRLPHRAAKADDELDDDMEDRGSPTSGSGRERAPAGKATYRLSAARVAAMKEAGIWDDQKARERAIKRYMEYDKAQAAEKGARK